MRAHPWSGLLSVAGAVAALILATGCSLQTRRYWLNVFFEGVPQDTTNRVASAPASGTLSGATNARTMPVSGPVEPPIVLHPPYADQKCNGCHESKYSNKIRANLGDLCLNCHNQVLTQGRSWHAPAASGDCALCHQPHQSARKFLLTDASNLLCALCHDPAEMAVVPAHRRTEVTDCTHCHDPHQGEGRFLLKSKGQPTDASILSPSAAAGTDGPAPAASPPGRPPPAASGGRSPAPHLTSGAALTPDP